jgi:hypothetical protein
MRNRLMAKDFHGSPRPADVPVRPETAGRKRSARPRETDSRRSAPSRIRGFVEIVSETLWIALLLMVIGFLSWKFPQISSAVDEISGSNPRSAASSDAPVQARVRELESRITGYENKIAPIEKSYAQLKQRHADLQKAYDSLQSASVREAYVQPAGNPRPTAAP